MALFAKPLGGELSMGEIMFRRILALVAASALAAVMFGSGAGPAGASLCDAGQTYNGTGNAGGNPGCTEGTASDADGDSLHINYEQNVSLTDPDDADSDDDLCPDGSEVEAGTDPNNGAEFPAVCPTQD